MKAVRMPLAGPPAVLEFVDVDEPVISLGSEMKVRLRAAGVNPIDTKIRARGLFAHDGLPAILGCDGAGVVEDVGIAVGNFKPGDEVWFCNGGLGLEQGNYAEYTVIDESVARRKPASLDFVEAAAGPLVLITAWEALYDRARLEEGETVLIHAGAGGVGHVAIQMAKLRGARVCTTVSSEAKADFVRTLGADHIIVYPETDFVDAVHEWTHGHGVDVALDTVGGRTFRNTMLAMTHYGRLVTLLDPGPDVVWKEARNRNLCINFELMLAPMLQDLSQAREHQGEILDQCRDWIDEGRLRLRVSQTLPLRQAADAHALVEQGHMLGKVVLSIGT